MIVVNKQNFYICHSAHGYNPSMDVSKCERLSIHELIIDEIDLFVGKELSLLTIDATIYHAFVRSYIIVGETRHRGDVVNVYPASFVHRNFINELLYKD